MTQQLEADLRAALATRASEVPGGAGARLRQLDYRPRSHRVRPPVAFGALAGAAGTAAVAASVVGLGAASSAFAGWTSSPTPAPDSQIAGADAACQARLDAMPGGSSSAGLKPVLTDTRGPFTVVIFAGAGGTRSCISSPSFTALSGSRSGAVQTEGVTGAGAGGGQGSASVKGGPDSATVPAGQVKLATVATTARDGSAYTVVEGRTGADVTGTSLVLADGRKVTASTANGWFVAWWPGAQSASAALVSTPSGVTTMHLDTGGPVLCGPGPCTRPRPGGTSGTVTNVTSGPAGGQGGGGPVTNVKPGH